MAQGSGALESAIAIGAGSKWSNYSCGGGLGSWTEKKASWARKLRIHGTAERRWLGRSIQPDFALAR